jgi:hypothetical protein
MALIAGGTPKRFIPEERLVAFVGDEVVYEGSLPDNRRLFLLAVVAERIVTEEDSPAFLPAVIIATLVGVEALGVRLAFCLLFMQVAVAGLAVSEAGAAGFSAWAAGL